MHIQNAEEIAMAQSWDFVFTWHIENFTMLGSDKFDSPVFFLDGFNHTRWFLQLRFYLKKRKKVALVPKVVDMVVFLGRLDNEYVNRPMQIQLGIYFEILRVRRETSFDSRKMYCTLDKNYTRLLKNRHKKVIEYLNACHCDDLTLRLTFWKKCEFDPTLEAHVAQAGRFSNRPRTMEFYSVVDDNQSCATLCRPNRCTVRSRVEVFRHSFTWRIEHLNLKQSTCQSSVRVDSSLRDLVSLSFAFLYQRDFNRSFQVQVRRIVPDYAKRTFATCSLTFVENEIDLAYCRKEHLFEGGDDEIWVLISKETGKMKFGERKEWYNKVLRNTGTLNIHIDIAMSHEDCHHHIPRASTLDFMDSILHPSDEALRDDIRKMFEQNKDVTLRVKDGSMMVHRIILSAQSSFFHDMLMTDFKEKNTGIVDFSETMSLDSLEVFVKFMYAIPTDCTLETALIVFKAAQMYDVPALAERCVRFIKANITVETAADAAWFADLYMDPSWMDSIKAFIVTHAEKVLQTPQWESLRKNLSQLEEKISKEVLAERMILWGKETPKKYLTK